jgi:hypothetical protein
MNLFSNIWNHPQTSAAGVLIGAITVAGVLAQQGVTLGRAGTGTVVSLAGAVATALLGLLAKDPGESASQPVGKSVGAGAKLGAWAMVALLVHALLVSGCSASAVAQEIVNWTPALETAVATVDSTAALLAPADAPVFTAATTGFDAAANLLETQAKAYLANPGASTLGQLQTQVVTFEQQVNAALLVAAKIVNPASQQHALAAIQAVGTIVTAILTLVQSVSSKSAVAQMAVAAKIKLAAVARWRDDGQAAEMVAAHYGEPVTLARAQVARGEQEARAAGF